MTGRAQPEGWFPMHVIPAKAGIQESRPSLGPCFRRGDDEDIVIPAKAGIQGSGPQEDKGSH